MKRVRYLKISFKCALNCCLRGILDVVDVDIVLKNKNGMKQNIENSCKILMMNRR